MCQYGCPPFCKCKSCWNRKSVAVMYVKRFKGWGAEICFKDTESFLNGCIVWMFCGCVLFLCCKNGPVGSGVPPWDRCGETQCLTEQEEAGVRFWASFLPETSKRRFWIQIFCSMKGNLGGVTLSEELQSKFWIWTLLKSESWRNCAVRNGFATDWRDMPSCPGSRDLFWARRLCLFL